MTPFEFSGARNLKVKSRNLRIAIRKVRNDLMHKALRKSSKYKSVKKIKPTKSAEHPTSSKKNPTKSIKTKDKSNSVGCKKNKKYRQEKYRVRR